MDKDKGFLYISVGEEFLQEAVISARNLKKVMPEYPIKIITHREVDANCFDEVEVVDQSEKYSEKVLHIDTPFKKTFYIDMDTKVVDRIDEVFEMLDEFDLALAHNPDRKYEKNPELPNAFPQLNGGIIAMKDNEKTHKFLDKWRSEYKQNGPDDLDQTSLARAIYNSSCRFTVLPPEYNCRFNHPGTVQGKVKIFHGRLTDIDKGLSQKANIDQAIQAINSDTEIRCHIPVSNKVKIYKTKYSALEGFKQVLSEEGKASAIRKALFKLPEIFKGKWRI